VFLAGVAVFTAASAVCGLAASQQVLVAARAVQGIGGAVVSAVSLSLMMTLFTAPAERAKAMGIFGFVSSGGGALGVLLGGVLTGLLNWHWIFLVNVPVGALVIVLTLVVVSGARAEGGPRRIDAAGAVTVTASLVVAVYAIVNGNQAGWRTGRTLGLLAVSGALLVIFVSVEARARSPLVPLRLLRRRNIAVANVIGVLWAAAMFAWFFLTALYLQLVLGYSPLQVGLAFLPGNLIMGAASVGLSARLVLRFGIRPPLSAGLLLAAAGLLLLARAPVHGVFAADVLPGMILLGLGAGTAFNPVLLAAMSDAEPDQAGLASGLVNTSFMMGGALGLAVLASLAASRTGALLAHGQSQAAALTGGYHAAFLAGAAAAAAAAALGATLLRAPAPQTTSGLAEAPGEPAPCTAFSVRDCRPSEQPG
jgi:EmrB/QacA subfamily drug resistance transporter